MNEATFLINIKRCKKILGESGILKKVNVTKVQLCTYKKYSNVFRTTAQKENYAKTFIVGLEMDDYDFLMNDGSYFQFSFDKCEKDYVLRMAFYPTINNISYDDFLHEFLESDIDECGGEFIEDYQQYLTEQEIKFVTPIRYDYNTKIYKPLVHSSAHVHFGYEEDIRVPTDNVLFPSAFVKLILQYFYYDIWKQKIMQGDFQDCLIESIEREIIGRQYWGIDEMKIPYISCSGHKN